jgi:hypothetical protein
MIPSTKETEQNKMKDKVTKLLVKWGHNENDAERMVEAHLDYAVKTYPDSKPAFIAEVVSAL